LGRCHRFLGCRCARASPPLGLGGDRGRCRVGIVGGLSDRFSGGPPRTADFVLVEFLHEFLGADHLDVVSLFDSIDRVGRFSDTTGSATGFGLAGGP